MTNIASDLGIFERRWCALDAMMAEINDHYAAQPEFPRKNSILYLLQSLRAFAAGQFNFFYYGLGDQGRMGTDPKLEPTPKFPTAFILDTLLLQVGFDLEVIQRAADQRISGSDTVRQALAIGDKLAWVAVRPAMDYGVVREATTALTYFQKSTDIRVIPYAQVALIGIPFSCTTNRQDYLAIPHEVGHYVFRHPTRLARTIHDDTRKTLEDKIPPPYGKLAKDWYEETFADIYGCLIAGPVMALDFQSLELQHSEDGFVTGDGKHPVPILRPRIYTKVLANPTLLKYTQGDWGPIAHQLDALWAECIAARDVPQEFNVQTTGDPKTSAQGTTQTTKTEVHQISDVLTEVSLPEAKAEEKPVDKAGKEAPQKPFDEAINLVAKIVLESFTTYAEATPLRQYQHYLVGWAGEVTAKTQVAKLYDQFEENFDQLLSSIKLMPPDADPTTIPMDTIWDEKTHTSQFWVDWVTHDDNGFDLNTWPSLDQPIPHGDDADPGLPYKSTWRYILFADGWNTQGPCATPPG